MANGQQINSGQGSVVPSGSKALSGQQSTSGTGTIIADAQQGVALSGSASSFAQGSSPSAFLVPLRSRKVGGGSASRALSGIAFNGLAGNLTPVPLYLLSGSQFSGAQGTFTKSRTRALTGSQFQGVQGNVTLGAGTAPTAVSAAINGAGNNLTLLFSEAVTLGAQTQTPVANMSGGTVTLTFLSGADTNQRVFTMSRTVLIGETGTLSYTQPGDGYKALDDNALVASFSGLAINNNSSVQPPTLVSATIQPSGTSIRLVFSETVQVGSGGATGFTLSMSGGAASVVFASGSGTTALNYNIGRTIAAGETGTLAYVQPGNGIESVASGGDVVNFSGTTVTNNAGSPSSGLSWNTVTGATGYKIYWSANPGPNYTNSLDVGNVTSYNPTGLWTGLRYVSIRSYDASNIEGPWGAEIQVTL